MNGTIKANELKEGNVIRIEYGDYDNYVTCTVTSVSDELFLDKYIKVQAVSKNGMELSFCARPEQKFEMAA